MTTPNTPGNGNQKLKLFGSISRIAAIIFIGFSLFLLVSTIILIILTKPDREVTVPDVVGKLFIESYNGLVRKGLRPELKFRDIADTDDGLILSQYPKKGKVVPENSAIKLLVSRSRYYIDVPNLIGRELQMAKNSLRSIHRYDRTLSLGTGTISFIPSETVADGIVIDQNPPAGERVRPDRRVNLLVSSGAAPPNAVMPDVTGQSIELCYDLLRAMGLVIRQEIVATADPAASGTVAAQTPAKGSYIAKGQACTLRVFVQPLEKNPFGAYEKVAYLIPASAPKGQYEAQVEDRAGKRIRFEGIAGPGGTVSFVFRRAGNAVITILCNKKPVDTIEIDVD
ncbi:MAG: PASTA domain-containing protein [Spirochaetes bacterium]|nr:PASTA domain-containing protein [Spirochaetota bacterium]